MNGSAGLFVHTLWPLSSEKLTVACSFKRGTTAQRDLTLGNNNILAHFLRSTISGGSRMCLSRFIHNRQKNCVQNSIPSITEPRSMRWFLSIFGVSAAMSFGLLNAGATANADDVGERMPPDFVFEMIDPTLCLVPPDSVSDDEILDALASDDPDMAPPVSGIWQGARTANVMGQGYFNASDTRGLVVASDLILQGDEDTLHYLCLALMPHENTSMVAGSAALVGPDAEHVDGNTFMVVAVVGERRDGDFYPLAEVITEHGSATFKQPSDTALAGYLELTGTLESMNTDAGISGDVSLELDFTTLDHDSDLNPINWGSDDLVDASQPEPLAMDEATMEEIRALFLDGIEFAAEPLMLSEDSDMIQHDIYRYDYQIFAEQSRRDLLDRDRDQVFYHQDDHLVRITRPSTNMPLSVVNELISPDFVLDENSAEDFRDVLSTLYGEHFFEEVETDSILHPRPDQWAFVNGTFFDDYTAFNVFTNEEGRALDVRYELRFMPQ